MDRDVRAPGGETAAPAKRFVLIDSAGVDCGGFFRTLEEARGSAWGPRFRDGYAVVTYVRREIRLYDDEGDELPARLR
jgi:hypothetical protein